MKLKIPQIMVPIEEFPVIYENDYVFRAAEVIVDIYKERDCTWRGYESLHVLNSEGGSTGILTLRSILKSVSHDCTPRVRKSILFPAKHYAAESPVRVKSIMRKLDSGFVKLSDEVDNAIKVILSKNYNYVPVLNGTALVGMIRAIDLFWFTGEIL